MLQLMLKQAELQELLRRMGGMLQLMFRQAELQELLRRW